MMAEHVFGLLSEYIDDELSIDEKKKVDRHLQECITCKLEYDNLRELQDQLFLNFKYEEPSDTVVQHIHRHIAADQRERVVIKGFILVVLMGLFLSSALFVPFLSAFQTLGHIILVFMYIGRSVVHSLFTVLAGNVYISGSVIIAAILIILIMIPILKYLISSTSIEARRSTS